MVYHYLFIYTMTDNPNRPMQSENEIQQTMQSNADPEHRETSPSPNSLPDDDMQQIRAESDNGTTSDPPDQSTAPDQASATAPSAPAPVTAQATATGSAAPAEQQPRKSSRIVKQPDRPGMVTTTTARRSNTKKTSRQVEAQDSDEDDEEDEVRRPVIPPKKRGRPPKKRTPASRARSNRSAALNPENDGAGEDNNPSINVLEMTNKITDLAQRSFNVAESFGKFLRQHHPDEEAAIADVEASMQEVSERYSKKRKAASQSVDDGEDVGVKKGRGIVKQTGRIPSLYYSDEDD